jgi:hypothetical protein
VVGKVESLEDAVQDVEGGRVRKLNIRAEVSANPNLRVTERRARGIGRNSANFHHHASTHTDHALIELPYEGIRSGIRAALGEIVRDLVGNEFPHGGHLIGLP